MAEDLSFEDTKRLAEQGSAWAQFNLGGMYEGDWGVPQDYAEAAKWYRKAAEQGNEWAQTSLGGMYYNGAGVEQDYVSAYVWWNIAAANGHEEVSTNKDLLIKRMTPEQIAEAQRLSRECVDSNYRNCP